MTGILNIVEMYNVGYLENHGIAVDIKVLPVALRPLRESKQY